MDLSYELDENESNELLNMCLGIAPLWTFQNKTNTENPEINEQEFVKQMRNDNTVRKTKTVMNSFNKFVSQTLNKENVQTELLNPTELNNLIGKFLLSIRKVDGEEYEPDTITSYHRGIERYLREHSYKYSIIKDREFEMSRSVLASKTKKLK